ncbi:OsmC family protein [Methyloversatilis discipulorum]|uniref:OsmC family protein n=1 Tax=Methyloversatilis discipulorum TaxID=1119528 RepID=UPI00037D64B3|nr:OsmC family protein [Methyloversatilis discipulorum]
MSRHTAEILWTRGDQPFIDKRYSRRHLIRFDGGVEVAGSSSPHVVPLPYSAEDAVDPEEAFVAALASCHMLTFLQLAALKRLVVDRYEDAAEGELARKADGRMYVATVTLRSAVRFAGPDIPTTSELTALHHAAHEQCFIANSVLTEVRCEPRQSAD